MNHRYRIVTLEGDVVNPGGSMTGGAKKNSNQASLFTREKELDETASKLNRYEQKTKQFEHNLQEKQTKQEQLKKEIADLQEQKEIRKKSSKKKNNNYILSRINCPMYKIN